MHDSVGVDGLVEHGHSRVLPVDILDLTIVARVLLVELGLLLPGLLRFLLPLWLVLVFRCGDLVGEIIPAVALIVGVLTLLLELGSVAVGPRRDRHVALVEPCLRVVRLLGVFSIALAVAVHPINLGLVLLAGDLALLAVLRVVEEVIDVGRLVRLVVGANGLLNDEPAGIAPVLTQRGVVHLAASPARVDRVVLDHIVEDSVTVALDEGSVVGVDSHGPVLLIGHNATAVALGSDELGLHAVGDGLVAVLPDRGGVRANAADSPGVQAVGSPDVVERSGEVDFTNKNN